MAFTNQYKQFLRPEKRVSKGLIKPRNIYRITTYKGGDPTLFKIEFNQTI